VYLFSDKVNLYSTTFVTMQKKIIIAITGATGAIYGTRLLEILQTVDEVESHLILSNAGALTAQYELGMDKQAIASLADVTHNPKDIGATLSSGSFITHGMVIAPCSMKTLGCIANGIADNLVSRAADVVLKERRKLILMARETPLNLVHLRNMTTLSEMGAIIAPPVPAFYTKPNSIDDIVNHSVGRILDSLDIPGTDYVKRWQGIKQS
jgi:4-hydroxy-3-polyprenylbenzoate decarboxylase/2,5-furandicarboxylate decarboxylase 2